MCLRQLLSDCARRQPVGEMHVHLDRPVEKVLLFAGAELGHHHDQMHLAEFAAFKAREKFFHIDLDLDARNTVVQKAQKLAQCTLEEQEEEAAPKRVRLEFEDVGGQHVEEEQDDLESLIQSAKGFVMDPELNVADIRRLLTREAEVDRARHPTAG